MIHFNSFLRRLVAALLGLALMAGIGHAQTAFDNSSAQDAWNYSGTMVQRSSYNSELRCVTATADGVYVGVLAGSYYIEKYDHSGAFVSRFTRAFSNLVGVASSKTGNVYGFDYTGRGYAFSPSGEELFSFGLGYGNGDGYFNSIPGDTYTAIGVDSVGQIYVVDFYNYRVQVFNADGSFKRKIGAYGSLPGQFSNGVRSVALGPQDEVLVLDDSRYVTKFDVAGNYILKTTNGGEPWNHYSQLAFAASRDGQLMVGVLPQWYPYQVAQLVNITTMYSDRWRGDYYQNDLGVGRATFTNSLMGGYENYVRGAAFDGAGNVWLVRYNSAVSGGWTLERFERRMRFDNYKPTQGVPLPLVLSTVQQAGNPSVDISYRVDQSFVGGGTVSAGGTVTGGSIMSGGSVTTALVGWMGGIKNWSHLVVPSVGSGTHAASGAYFWSDMYDLSTRIDGRYPLQDWARCAAVDAAGNVYVITDYCVRKISPSGNVTTLAGLAGYSGYSDANGATARFQNPWSICVDANGNVFVTERDGRVIRKITPTGDVTTLAGSWQRYSNTDGVGQNAGFYYPGQITVDTSGSLYLADWTSGYIRKISQSGSVTTVGYTGQNIEGIAVDASGAVYVACMYSHKILKVIPDGTTSGVVTTFAGSGSAGHLDGNGTNATFWEPRGITLGPDGNFYVTENQGNLIRMITPNGDVTTIGKTGDLVYNVAVDAAGSIYAPGSSTTAGIGGRMVRRGTRSASTSFGIGVTSGSLGAGVQTGTVQTVKWDVAQDMPGMSFASLSFEIIAKAAGPEIGAHFVTIPSDSMNASDLRISNRPIDESDLGDLWLWLLANRDPRLAISGNSVIMTQAGLDYISDAPKINGSDATDTSNIVHTGGSGGADGNWGNWGSTTDRGRAFAYKYLNYRPVTGSDITRANAGRYNLNTVNNYSAVNLAP